MSDGTLYINDNLNLANVSFLYRHSWLSKLLKFKSDEWRVLLKLVAQEVTAFASLAAQQAFLEQKYFIKAAGLSQAQVDQLLRQVFHRDVLLFASPKSAREFVEKIDRLTDTGFKADELSWLLAADRDAKAAMKETDAARFLLALRTRQTTSSVALATGIAASTASKHLTDLARANVVLRSRSGRHVYNVLSESGEQLSLTIFKCVTVM